MNLFHRFVAQTMQGTDRSLGLGWGEGDSSRSVPPTGLGELLPLPELQSRHAPCSGTHGTTVANTSVQAPQAEAAQRIPRISQSGALKQAWIVQSDHLRQMDESACLEVKNIGKPSAGKLHARFDEGRLATRMNCLTRSSRVQRGVKRSQENDGTSFLFYLAYFRVLYAQ